MVVIVTDIPSPYQVDLFNEIAASGCDSLRIVFVRQRDESRDWEVPPLFFEHCFLDSEDGWRCAMVWIRQSEFVAFGCYAGAIVQWLIWERFRLGGAWALWGERPGANLRGIFGRALRASAQLPIRISNAAIWGIGKWGVEGYRVEIGGERLFLNVPYYSDLSKFFEIKRCNEVLRASTKFLFCGSLIKRKGVDLLFNAFIRLVKEEANVTLTFVGNGPLEQEFKSSAGKSNDRIKFLGFKQRSELPAVFSRHDVLCAPSRYDGWGLIVPEAQAAGMPVIATNAMGAARDLISTRNGWMIPPNDELALLAALREAAQQSGEQRWQMIERARNSARYQHVDYGVKRIKEAVTVTIASHKTR